MANTIRLKRRITGGSGSPTAGVEGEVALNFSGGSTATPELWAHGGALGWMRLNPGVTITTQSVTLPAGADIGAAYTSWATTPANVLTGNVIIGVFGTPAQAYVLTNKAAPGVASSWTSLGGAVSFATAAQIVTGTDTTGAINSAVLAGAAVNGATVPATTDAGKYVRVGASGKIAAALLPIDAVNLKGAIAATATAPTAPVKGDSYFLSAGGVFPAGWTGIATQTGKVGDRVLFDGTNWHLIPNGTDLNAYLALAGGTMGDTAAITFANPTTALSAPVVRINGADATKSAIDGFTIDMGNY